MRSVNIGRKGDEQENRIMRKKRSETRQVKVKRREKDKELDSVAGEFGGG